MKVEETDAILKLVSDVIWELNNAYSISEKYEHDQYMDSEAEMKTYIDECSSDTAEARKHITTALEMLNNIETSLEEIF